MMNRRILQTLIPLLVLLPTALWGDDNSDDFLRIHRDLQGQPQALQVAIKSYTPTSGPADDLLIDLIAAVHIGDASYYAALNHYFRRYDVVLYELVAPQGHTVKPTGERRGGVISSTQMAMTDALDLSFQLDEIDYGAKNFVHADLSPDEVTQDMHERGESLYSYFWKLFYVSMEEVGKDPLGLKNIELLTALLESEQEQALKTAFAIQLLQAKSITAVFEGENGSTIIAARNMRALDVLRRQIAKGHRHIGIFYGAAHMNDMENRLLERFAVKKQRTAWIDAWRLSSDADQH